MLGNPNYHWRKPRGSRGNFDHLRWLLDELDKPLLLRADAPGEPTKSSRDKLARCPAAHNRLLGEKEKLR